MIITFYDEKTKEGKRKTSHYSKGRLRGEEQYSHMVNHHES
jgi:hypothetical protein